MTQQGEREQRDREARILSQQPPAALWEIDRTLARWRPGSTDRVLDVGCGVGELVVRYASQTDRVIATDFSRRSLQLLASRADQPGNVAAVQSDATALPFPDKAFDAVLCAQLIEHLPTRALRAALVSELARVLRPGGKLVLTAYNFNLTKRLHRWIDPGNDRGNKEGFHSDGRIYYYNFSRAELVRLLAPLFHVRECTGIRNTIPKLSRWLGEREPRFNRALEGTPFASWVGWLLIATCERR